MLVAGNVIQGWREDAVVLDFYTPPDPAAPPSVIVRNNDLDGVLRLRGAPANYRSLIAGNASLSTLTAVVPVVEPVGPEEEAVLEMERRKAEAREASSKRKAEANAAAKQQKEAAKAAKGEI
jgi:hypothetical protein